MAKSGSHHGKRLGADGPQSAFKNTPRTDRRALLRKLLFLLEKWWWLALRDNLSTMASWEALGGIGRSSFGRATILAPFVGYLIIFNPTFVEFFSSTLPSEPSQVPPAILSLHSSRLSFLYFGLLLLGTGIAAFLVFAPEQQRHYRSLKDYLEEMNEVAPPTLVEDRLSNTVSNFCKANPGEAGSPFFSQQSASFPTKAAFALHDLIAEIFRDTDLEDMGTLAPNEETGTMFQASPHAFAVENGYITTDGIMRIIDAPSWAERSIRLSLLLKARTLRKQVFYVDYISSNYSSFSLRLLVGFLFSLSFLLLLIPTLTTSILVFYASMS